MAPEFVLNLYLQIYKIEATARCYGGFITRNFEERRYFIYCRKNLLGIWKNSTTQHPQYLNPNKVPSLQWSPKSLHLDYVFLGKISLVTKTDL